MHKSSTLTEKDINIPFLLSPQRNSKIEKNNTLFSNELKQKKLSESSKNNKIYKNMSNKALFLKKINLKDDNNKPYLDGIYKIFNDEKLFFDKCYKGKKIVVGKSHNSKNEINIGIKSDKKNFIKRGSIISKGKELNPSSTNITYRSNNNYTESLKQNSRNRRLYKKKENYITDEELKNIYKKWIDREKKNKGRNKNSFNMKKERTFSAKEFDNILNLQNLILERRKEIVDDKNKLEERILRQTAKHRDKLLINQINDYRIKKEEIEEIEKNNDEENNINNNLNNNNYKYFNKKNYLKIKDIDSNLQWLTSLRNYQSNININNNIDISSKIIKNPKNLKNKRCNSTNNLSLKNRIPQKKYFNSFDKKEIIFNLTGHLNPIYAQLIPKNYNYNEKIRDTFNIPQNLKKNNILFKKMNNDNNNIYKGLNIQGKKLLNFEIELSKELEGKKKRLVQFSYLESDLKNKLFAQSFNCKKNYYIPKSVKNTFNLHYD